MKVAELSEPALVARVQQRFASPPPWLVVPIGDDAAVVEPERNQLEVLTVDAVIDGVHFDRRFTPPEAIGHRALAVNLSDIAAMGAAPRLALLSFALPPDVPLDDFDGIITGIAALATMHRVAVVGGNLTSTPGPLTVDVTVIGSVKRRHVLRREGARPGDELFVTGTVGSARAGLQILRSRMGGATGGDVAPLRRAAGDLGLAPGDLGLVTAFLFPQPRVRFGILLGRNRAATACIDLSDGLADGVHRIAAASGVGIELDPAALPIDAAARRWCETNGMDPVAAAMTGGDDYELLFTARRRTGGRLAAVRNHGGVAFTRIGLCTADPAVRLRYPDATTRQVGPGYDHFGGARRTGEDGFGRTRPTTE